MFIGTDVLEFEENGGDSRSSWCAAGVSKDGALLKLALAVSVGSCNPPEAARFSDDFVPTTAADAGVRFRRDVAGDEGADFGPACAAAV